MKSFVLILTSLFVLSCDKPICLKDKLTKSRYYIQNSATNESVSYFTISGSTHTEYVNGKFGYRSHVSWRSCSSYVLTLTEIADSTYVKVGDSAFVELLSFNKDTFAFRMTGKGFSYESKFFLMKDSLNNK